MSYLVDIPPLRSENLSGILTIRIARVRDLIYFPPIIAGQIRGDITFLPGSGFIPWTVTYATGMAGTSTTDGMEGSAAAGSMDFTLPSAHIDEELLRQMAHDRFIALYCDANGKPIVIGSPSSPLTFSYTANTGRLGTGRNEYACTLTASGPMVKAIYRGELPDYIPALLVFDSDGNLLATLFEGQTLSLTGDFDYSQRLDPYMPTPSSRFAFITYSNGGSPVTVPIALGRRVILTSDFSLEFDLP
jgi:hypothetical protein